MILNELFKVPVTGSDGAALGRVVDIRFVLENASGAGRAQLYGFIVSPHTTSSFLGYERSYVNRPWPIGPWLAWRHRDSFLVRWGDVESLSPAGLGLRAGFTRYDSALPPQ